MTMTRVEIAVMGMHCEGCEHAVQAALARMEGVRGAQADHKTNRVRVSFDPERVGEQRLRAQIKEAGYRPVTEAVS
jgi:copper chaperone